MLVTIDTSQLLGAISRDMFELWFCSIIVTSLCTNAAARTCFQSGFQRLVQLGFKSLESEFNGFSHEISLYCFRVWKYIASPKEFSEEDAREEEIQAVADLA